MNKIIINRSTLILSAALVGVVLLGIVNLQSAPAQGQPASMGATPHFTVVETQGHNLIVTNNHTNELYFYTIDPNTEIGSELKLRGRIDLNQVGKPAIKPVTHKSAP